MYIDPLFVRKRRSTLQHKNKIDLPDLARQLSIQKDLFSYLISLPEKMTQGKPLYENETWKEAYDTLLANKNPLMITSQNFSGQTTVGNAFAMYLEESLKYSRELEFLTELQK